MKRCLSKLVTLLAVVASGCAVTPPGRLVELHVSHVPITPVAAGLFGQFMERATWGEPGPESALVPGTHQLQPKAVDLLHATPA